MDDESRTTSAAGPSKPAAPVRDAAHPHGVYARRRAWRLPLAILVVGLVAAAFVWDYAIQKNFEAVVPGKIYRSGQPGREQLEDWIEQYGLKTIVTLRHSIPAYEKELAERYRVQLLQFTFSAKTGLAAEQWEDIRRVLSDEQNLPVLVHCRSGVDRTGMVIALYRIENQGWPVHKAVREMIRNYHLPFQYPVLTRQLEEAYQDGFGTEVAPMPAP